MGDTRVKDKVETDKDERQDASSRLRDDALGQMRRAGNDGGLESGGNGKGASFDNPYAHIQMAGVALRELAGLKDRNPDEEIEIKDASGRTVEKMKVGDRRIKLLAIAEREFDLAVAAADRIDQAKIPDKLLQIRHRQQQAADIGELQKLQELETMLESMKHAPSVARFAYATFLADVGELARAKKLLDESAKLDPEAKLDRQFKEVYDSVDKALKDRQSQAADGKNPFETLSLADEKRKKGDAAGAEVDYKAAVEQADKIDTRAVVARLTEIEQAKKDNANNPAKLEELKALEQGLSSLAHAGAITRVNYADFLIEQKRYKEAMPLLIKVAKDDPELVKDNADFIKLVELARNEGKQPEAFDNPFDHLQRVEQALNNQDLDTARKELVAAVNAADKIDRKLMQHNKKVIEEQLKEEKDPEQRKRLEELHKYYDAFDHASGMTRVALARFELANKNYNNAQTLLADVERFDAALAAKPELEFAKLKEMAKEPSTWQKIWGFTKDLLKELACDAVAVLAGVGAGLGVGALTSLSGPGAVVAGGAAGAAAGGAAYTFMKTVVFGEEFHWSMPLWGALDGASGGIAAVARSTLVRVGGKIVTKEMAEAAVLKTGGKVAALEGLEGIKMAQTAQTLSKQGLKEMGKGLGLWTRFKSSIPLTGAGNAEYRAALSAYRGLKYTNLGVKMGIDAGTVAAGSLVYRGGKEGYKWATGEHQSAFDFAKAYGLGVVKDTATGATIGAYSLGFGSGLTASALKNGIGEGIFGGHQNFGDMSKAWLMGMGSDAILGTPNLFIGGSAGRFADYAPRLQGAVDTLWQGSALRWNDYYQTRNYLKAVEATLQDLQRPPTEEEVRKRMYWMPGTNRW